MYSVLLQVAKENAPAAEYGSAQAWGSKKSNLNQLLNFHFESRDCRDHHSASYGVSHYGDGRRGFKRAPGYSLPYNKERFLQAKYVYWECLSWIIITRSVNGSVDNYCLQLICHS